MPADPEPREAVRIVGDGFPLEFLRPDECVKPAKPPQKGVSICPHPTDALNSGLAVPPEYWIVRESTGELRLWADESFKAKFRRINREWVPPTQREPEDIPGMPAFSKALREMPSIPASEAMDELDRIGMPRTDGPKILDIGQRVRLLCDRHEELVRERLGLRPLDERVGTPLDRLEGIAQERWERIGELEAERDELAAECKQADERATEALVRAEQAEEKLRDREVVDDVRKKVVSAREVDVDRVHNLLDGWDVPRSPGDERPGGGAAKYSLYQRVHRLTQRLRRAESGRAAGNVRPGTRELRVVLRDVAKEGRPPDYRFIELEDQDRRGVGGFEIIDDDEYRMIVIPYGRDDEWVTEVAYQAAGACSGVFLREDPQKVMPSEAVGEAVAELLRDFNIEVPESYGNRLDRAEKAEGGPNGMQLAAKALDLLVEARERFEDATGEPIVRDRINHAITAAHMVVEPPALLSKEEELRQPPGGSCDEERGLSEYEEKLLHQREEARAGESRLMEQRNASLSLLRWLIGDLIPPYPGFEEED